jgi:hypothetical protein
VSATALLNMTPHRAADNAPRYTSGDAELLRQGVSRRNTRVMQASQFSNLLRCQFRVSVGFTTVEAFRVRMRSVRIAPCSTLGMFSHPLSISEMHAPLSNGIFRIVKHSAQPQVIRLKTGRGITCVEYPEPIGNRAMCQSKRRTVNIRGLIGNRNDSVSPWKANPLPEPTAIGCCYFDTIQQSLCKGTV